MVDWIAGDADRRVVPPPGLRGVRRTNADDPRSNGPRIQRVLSECAVVSDRDDHRVPGLLDESVATFIGSLASKRPGPYEMLTLITAPAFGRSSGDNRHSQFHRSSISMYEGRVGRTTYLIA